MPLVPGFQTYLNFRLPQRTSCESVMMYIQYITATSSDTCQQLLQSAGRSITRVVIITLRTVFTSPRSIIRAMKITSILPPDIKQAPGPLRQFSHAAAPPDQSLLLLQLPICPLQQHQNCRGDSFVVDRDNFVNIAADHLNVRSPGDSLQFHQQ